jgi:hypothetical protein
MGVREGKNKGGGKKFALLFRIVPELSKKNFTKKLSKIVVHGGEE